MRYEKIKKNKKFILLIIMFIISLLTSTIVIFAAEPIYLMPEDNQYFELRAVEIKDVVGKNKQVIMELWGNNIEFKRL